MAYLISLYIKDDREECERCGVEPRGCGMDLALTTKDDARVWQHVFCTDPIMEEKTSSFQNNE